VARRLALRYDELALQAGNVIDAQAAGMAHVGTHGCDERRVVSPQCKRVELDDAPLLAVRIEIIG
jgi:hypothetical protein